MKRTFCWWAGVFLLVLPSWACAQTKVQIQGLKPIALPQPQITGGKPLMQALSERRTRRDFSAQKPSLQTLSNLLWAGFGVNRPGSGRTAPSANDAQEIDIYVFLPEGVYLYDAPHNQLQLVMAGDLRAQTGTDYFVPSAPVTLTFIADFDRFEGSDAEFYSAADTGFISQNIYLYCASEGMSTVVVGAIDRKTLAKKLNLRANQKIILSQIVGYPK